MILTDLFGEDISTNCHVLYFPLNDMLGDIVKHIGPGTKDFSHINVCCVAVGHHDLETRLGEFVSNYRRLVTALRNHNAYMHLFVMSVLPVGPDATLHKYASLKSQQVKDHFGRKPGITYVNLYASLNIQGEIPPEFLRNHKLNRSGIKRFFSVFSRSLVATAL